MWEKKNHKVTFLMAPLPNEWHTSPNLRCKLAGVVNDGQHVRETIFAVKS